MHCDRKGVESERKDVGGLKMEKGEKWREDSKIAGVCIYIHKAWWWLIYKG